MQKFQVFHKMVKNNLRWFGNGFRFVMDDPGIRQR